MTYSEKLQRPEWQRKRLKIMERDGWACQDCGDTSRTLHVHHIKYIIGREPWDYPSSNFKTLCELCHEKTHGKPTETKLRILTQSSPEVVASIANTIKELTTWFYTTHGVISLSEQYLFIREYKFKCSVPASNEIIVLSALASIYKNITVELKGSVSDERQTEVLTQARDIQKLRVLLSKEVGFFGSITM